MRISLVILTVILALHGLSSGWHDWTSIMLSLILGTLFLVLINRLDAQIHQHNQQLRKDQRLEWLRQESRRQQEAWMKQ